MTALASSFRKTKFEKFFEGFSTSIPRKTYFFGAETRKREEWMGSKKSRKMHQKSKYRHLPRGNVFSTSKVHCVKKSARSEQNKSVSPHTNRKPRVWLTYCTGVADITTICETYHRLNIDARYKLELPKAKTKTTNFIGIFFFWICTFFHNSFWSCRAPK